MRVAVVNRKGGVAKTTSSVFLASALAGRGKTLLVDCDPQGSALTWAEGAERADERLPFATVGLPVADVNRKVSKLAEDYDHVVLDTPPGEERISRSALLAAQTAIIAVSPAALDIDRLRPTIELVAEVEALTGELGYWILFTRVRRITRESRDARTVLDELELPVFSSEIPLLSSYSDAFGHPVGDALDYEGVVAELLGERTAVAGR